MTAKPDPTVPPTAIDRIPFRLRKWLHNRSVHLLCREVRISQEPFLPSVDPLDVTFLSRGYRVIHR